MPSENGIALWKNLCSTLINKQKRTILAYAELGKVINYDGQSLTLGLSTMVNALPHCFWSSIKFGLFAFNKCGVHWYRPGCRVGFGS